MFEIFKKTILTGYPTARFCTPPPLDFLCTLCGMVAREPLECRNCTRLFCTLCLFCKNQLTDSTEVSCPFCSPSARPQKPSKVLLRIINELVIYCKFTENGCQERHSLGKILNHESICKFRTVKCDNSQDCKKSGIAHSFVQAQFSFISLEGYVCSDRCKNILKFQSLINEGKLNECLKLYYNTLRSKVKDY